MKDNHLKMLIQSMISLEDQEWEFIIKNSSYRTLGKKEIIHTQGDVFDEVWLLINGSARSYLLDENGKLITWQLYFKSRIHNKLSNLILDDSTSYYENKGSNLFFETIDKSDFLVLKLSFLEDLFQSNMKWQYLGRLISHNVYYSNAQQRALSLMSASAQNRYDDLLETYPDIHDLTKSQYIASYLNVAPQTLSKLKK